MTRAKICGITRLEDALLAEALGAWALGFILAPGTKRYLEAEQIRPISEALGPFVVRVGVFVDTPPEIVLAQMQTARLQVAQLHGSEPPEWAAQIRRFYPVIKAFRLSGPARPDWLSYPADALLVDGVSPGSGQGYPLDWLAPLRPHPRLIVAGGLTPHNLQPVLELKPYAVDVSSGVEAAPRLKDPLKLRQFLAQVASSGTSRNQ
ncbi:phosphoribosylanthranilate isomerase [Meiothermus sp. CFH 77666]|uniref:phosphoribosylanthranilate isomerase n=1 Tax=Meiothermus sp. CFH 77666 TaxID=2817942 RepID=UPI001AA02E2A|nr:phosphoribosylanthranilate isomerase [Meiothermus sp. CFH 77666]MBO1436748.1 phosphoribosylanthranilate isomerase [Meiothermus sp. CFH 77666]